jgi:hypothetical protein
MSSVSLLLVAAGLEVRDSVRSVRMFEYVV